MQKCRYTISLDNGFIQRYPKGSNTINAFLSPSSGEWIGDDSFSIEFRQRPISPQVVAYFIAEKGYNADYFLKQS